MLFWPNLSKNPQVRSKVKVANIYLASMVELNLLGISSWTLGDGVHTYYALLWWIVVAWGQMKTIMACCGCHLSQRVSTLATKRNQEKVFLD